MKKRKITIISMIIITLSIVIFSGVSIFSNSDKSANKTLAYFYDGEGHSNPPSKDSYEVDVVNCNKAVGNWSNKDWTITLSDIEGKAECIISFKKRLPIHSLRIDPSDGTYKGSTGIQEVDVKETSSYQLSIPTRKGYTFVGWDVEGEQSKVNQNTFTMGIENSKVTAKWEINKYKVTIQETNLCDREELVEYNSYVELCNPVREGYTLTGWNVETEDNKYKVDDKDVVIKPVFVANNYNYIVYHKKQGLNGGYEVVDTQTGNAAFNTSVSPNTKSYTGFTSPQKKTITISSDTNTNVITYEYTRNKYTLTINPNGGTTTTPLTQEVYFEGQVNVVSPTKTGYTFTSWSGATLQDTTLTMPASNVTLNANYTANTYTLYFDANGGSVTPTQKSVTYNSTYGNLPTPIRDGYTFLGWFINGTKIESTSVVKITQSTSAVANWTKGSYILTINPQGGTYNNSTSTYQKGMEYQEEFTVADPTRVGYTFNGWEVTGTNATYDSSTKVFKMGSSNATLSAKWTINKYKLTIEGTNSCDGVYNLDYQETKTLCEPTNTGHTFAGWEDNDSLIQNDVVTMKAKNSTVRAKWTTNTYNYIVYHNKMNLDGETYTRVDADTYNASSEYGTVVVTEAKTYTGFKSLSNKSITIGVENNNQPTNNVVNYNYEREKYTLTINPNGGTYTGNTTKSLYYEEQITLSNPTKVGYNFSGWSATNGTVSDNKYTMPASNSTLTANYTAKTYTVTFNPNGGSLTSTSKTVTYDSTYGTLPTPVRTNYDFLGWYTDPTNGTKVESTTIVKITNNQTLYAHWKIQTVTITYDANGGSVAPTSIEINKGSIIEELPTPTHEELGFNGWWTLASGGEQITTSTVFNSSQTIYAHWSDNRGVSFIQNLVEGEDDSTIDVIDKGTGSDGCTYTLAYDNTADNNLRYVGANPCNYVSFNNESWRIIGIMNNIENERGEKHSLIKLRIKERLGIYSWDTSTSSDSTGNSGYGINQWGESETYDGADLMRELNTDYLGTVTVGTDGKWYNGIDNEKDIDKPSSILSGDTQNMIESVVWNLGSPNNNNGTNMDYNPAPISVNMRVSDVYIKERSNLLGKICTGGDYCNDTVTRTPRWTGKVGLFYPSDYLYATSGGTTTNRLTCLNAQIFYDWGGQLSNCKDYDWLHDNIMHQWTLSPGARNASIVSEIAYTGAVCNNQAYELEGVYPVVFLKSTIKITGGTGTSSDPYILSQ